MAETGTETGTGNKWAVWNCAETIILHLKQDKGWIYCLPLFLSQSSFHSVSIHRKSHVTSLINRVSTQRVPLKLLASDLYYTLQKKKMQMSAKIVLINSAWMVPVCPIKPYQPTTSGFRFLRVLPWACRPWASAAPRRMFSSPRARCSVPRPSRRVGPSALPSPPSAARTLCNIQGWFILCEWDRDCDFFFDLCRCLIRILNWILYEPIWERCRFGFNISEP